MFPWGGEINYEGTSLILSRLQLFLMCTGNGKTTLSFARTSPFLTVNPHLPRERRWRRLLLASALSSGSAEEALFCILCE